MKNLKFFIAFCLIFLKSTAAHPKKSQICTSQECQDQADTLLSRIDTSVSPCDDFYQFACGNYNNRGSVTGDHQISINRWIIDLAKEPLDKNDDKLIELIKTFYQSCMSNKGSLNDFIEDGMNIRRKIGTTTEDEVEFSLENVIQDLQFFQDSDGYFFSTDVGVVDEYVLLVVDQPKFETKAGFLDRTNEKVQEFYTNFVNFLVNEGNNRAEIEKMKEEAFKFEDELLELIDENSKAQIEISTIGEFQKIFKFINCTTYMKRFFSGSDLIDENFIIGIKNREILMKLDKFLFESSDDDILNYLVWRYIESAYITIDYSDEDADSADKMIFDASKQNSERTPITCLGKMKEELDIAVAAVYARNFVTKNDQKEITEMIKSMKNQLFDTLESLDWLDDKTRSAAARKLSAMKFYVGYPDILLDDTFLSAYYKTLDISKRSLVQIYDQISKLKKEKTLDFLTHQKITDDIEKEIVFIVKAAEYIATPNAAYDSHLNAFLICAGLIRLFSVDGPQAMNFGAIGYTIGHEIFHGFDDSGRLYDEHGNRKNWWGKEAENKFKQKSKCFIDQYGSYVEPVTGLKINGIKNLDENIADNGGLMLAYNTFQNVSKFDPILPNANFTSNQLFWLSMAQFYCNNYDYTILKEQIEDDKHTPGRFRVIGTLGNLKEFSDDFQCPEGSEMNRKNKCKIW